ncbi:5212_t:CDS:2, partial [Cetraspora pellucida]
QDSKNKICTLKNIIRTLKDQITSLKQLNQEATNHKNDLDRKNASLVAEITYLKKLKQEETAYYEQLIIELNHKDALIQEYAYQFKNQHEETICFGQTCKYLTAKLNNKMELVLPSELEKKTLER